ncbi:MAG: nucleotidyltransferase family protein [Eubacterium sp.]|nr:nucleotidyltransferase family protein [Eubacterium sp.]
MKKTEIIPEEDRTLLQCINAVLEIGNENDAAGKDVLPFVSERIVDLAEKHQVLSVLYPLTRLPDMQESCRDRIVISARTCTLQFYRLLLLTKYYCELLNRADIPVLVLKGVSAASYYPVPEYRKSGDVDLLLLRPGDMDRAVQILLQNGTVRSSDQHANHHVAFRSPDGIEMELHTSAVENVFPGRSVPMLKKAEEQMRQERTEKEILGIRLPVLRDGAMAFQLLLHMLQHYLGSGFGLRLLLDWAVLWNGDIPDEEIEKYRGYIEQCGLSRFSDLVTETAVRCLGLEQTKGQQIIFRDTEQELLQDFMQEVFESGEFGREDSSRIVMVEGGGLPDYLAEFHRQMHRNYPKAGRWPVIWPVLWVCTLVRFLVNNHNVRGTSVRSVLKSARKRGKSIRSLHLFEI